MSEIKQVIVVRKDLNMRKGKIAAQVSHASMKILLDLMNTMQTSHDIVQWSVELNTNDPLHTWMLGQFTKIVLYIPDLNDMLNLKDRAEFLGIRTALIVDAGKTEFHNKPTPTALALGPDDSDVLAELTGDLKLI
jgi:PTH2 family peptidyl-tRNA hydrolase